MDVLDGRTDGRTNGRMDEWSHGNHEDTSDNGMYAYPPSDVGREQWAEAGGANQMAKFCPFFFFF